MDNGPQTRAPSVADDAVVVHEVRLDLVIRAQKHLDQLNRLRGVSSVDFHATDPLLHRSSRVTLSPVNLYGAGVVVGHAHRCAHQGR
jgi:hypothetical protein